MSGTTMPQSIKKSIPARDLPQDWPERAQFGPDERVTIWIEREDAELDRATSLQEVMDIISRRALARGLTPEELTAALDDA